MKENNPYKVPQGYFASLEESILNKTIHANKTSEQTTEVGEDMFSGKQELDIKPVVDIEPRDNDHERANSWRSLMGFAAGFIIFVALAYGGFNLLIGSTTTNRGAEQEDILANSSSNEQEIQNNLLMDMNEYELVDMLFEGDYDGLIAAQDVVEYINECEDLSLDDFTDF